MNNIDISEELKPEKMDLIQLIRTFKREGIENFITIRREKFENLIAENKELKEENKCLKNKELDYMTVYLTGTYDERDKWKSKVKEKIEELREKVDGDDYWKYTEKDYLGMQYQIEVLQELLNERNNTDE